MQTNEPNQFTANFIYDDGDFRTETALNVNLDKKEENNTVIPDGTYNFSCQPISINDAECVGTTTGSILPYYATRPSAPLSDIIVFNGEIYNGAGYGNTFNVSENGGSIIRNENTATYSITEDSLTIEITLTMDNSTDSPGEIGFRSTEFQETKLSFTGSWNSEINEYVGYQTYKFTLNAARNNNNPEFEGWTQNANCVFVYPCSIKLN